MQSERLGASDDPSTANTGRVISIPWKSLLVLVSNWTDPVYVSYRARRLLRRAGPQAQERSPDRSESRQLPVRGSSTVERSSDAYGLADLEVDLVYIWVHGQDPAHREKRNHWLRQYGLSPVAYNPDIRYVEADELRYSLRSAELFLPWVRRIFLVTDNQVPEWLDLTNPKLRLVDHTEIMPRPEWLPTFNSLAIEAQLHNIPGLAEHFIACNDDHFFGQPCAVADFFTRQSERRGGAVVPRVMISHSDDDWIIPAHQVGSDPLAQLWMAGWNNVKVALEMRRPWRKVRRIDIHQALSITRSALRAATERFSRDYRRTSARKFRSRDSINFLALARYSGLADGTAVRGSVVHRVYHVESDLRGCTRPELPALFCINGGPGEAVENEVRPLQRLFPQPSSFEKAGGVS